MAFTSFHAVDLEMFIQISYSLNKLLMNLKDVNVNNLLLKYNI